LKAKANANKNKLKKYYDSLVTEPDFGVPYVIVNLHYQPEMTSSPCGDIFVDQRLCIEVLAKHLPADYLIYVKEHPSQFYAQNEGHTGRIPQFYDDLLAYPQVRLLPLHCDPFLLFRNAKAVATVTGTSGWEAMMLGKPVIIFGLAWYEKYAGVLKIVDEKSAAHITRFIENFEFDERDLLAYLNAFGNISVRAYAQYGMKERMNQDEAECVSNLAACIDRLAHQ
jgi:capsule polysaccharide export protein KpsC/LpsZ